MLFTDLLAVVGEEVALEFFPDFDAVDGLGVGLGVGLGLEVLGSSGSTVGLMVIGAAVGGFVITSESVTIKSGLITAVMTSPELSWILSDREPLSTIFTSASVASLNISSSQPLQVVVTILFNLMADSSVCKRLPEG